MGDYNLTGLHPREFEHLIQALAIQEIGVGVTPFGDGPDGGREATFSGRMNYPSITDPWNGYLVIQCKFLSRPMNDTTKDGEWALNQLEADLKKFIDTKRNLTKPEYYIFATNIVLTPVQNIGSKDKVNVLLETYSSMLGMIGFDVWDFDKICRFLDNHDSIRNRYLAFISSGDVLAKILNVVKLQEASFENTISRFLQHELLADLFVKLEQAGHTAEHKTLLGQVFVDLPASQHLIPDFSYNEHELERSSRGVVQEVLIAGSRILKRSKYVDPSDSTSTTTINPKLEPGRFVLVGGPGQGKSTVGQFVCQLYRTTILKDRPQSTLIPEVLSAINLFGRQCHADQLDLPTVRRFPIRVILEQFATELAKGKIKSLLGFILERVNYRTDDKCSIDDLKRWLTAYPWLVVLDGLDEVPATSNRRQVLEKIHDFWMDIASLDADVLVLATTRPQGYSDDFSPRFYRHRYLVPLSQKRAMHYARRLVEAQHPTDPDRRERILKRLTMACEQDTTRRLMRSPLQVTIMATLVDRIGQPPQERWRLFQQYYEVIYQRETERDIPASVILQQRKSDVNAIHQRVGLQLQALGEKAGSTESKLDIEQFKQLAQARIAEEGHEGTELQTRITEITDAALQRLVFLVGLRSDRIGFEIRSLQEFMAAEAIMDGKDEQIRVRLEAIAPIIHWRNVFLFAAGKCFADRQVLRDMIVGICEQLNDPHNDKLAGTILAGSRLALDILEDGVTREQPKFARSLARLAMRLMEVPDTSANARLAATYTPVLDILFREQIEQRIEQANFSLRLGAWTVLLALLQQGITWTQELADSFWPNDIDQQHRIIQMNNSYISCDWFAIKTTYLMPKISPKKFASLLRPDSIEASEPSRLPDWYNAARYVQPYPIRYYDWRYPDGERAFTPFLFLENKRSRSVRLSVPYLYDSAAQRDIPLKNIPLNNPSWAPYISAARFIEDPRCQTLASELKWLSQIWEPQQHKFYHFNFAWPLAACLSVAKDAEDLIRFSERAEAGDFGDFLDWKEAENRWKRQGVTAEDLASLTNDRWPYPKHIADTGFPLACASIAISARDTHRVWDSIWNYYNNLPMSYLRLTFASLLLDTLSLDVIGVRRKIAMASPHQIKLLLTEDPRSNRYSDWISGIDFPKEASDEWIEMFEWLGNNINDSFAIYSSNAPFGQIAQEYINKPNRHGLLKFIASASLFGNKFHLPEELLLNERFDSFELQQAAFIVRMIQNKWPFDESKNLAKLFVAINKQNSSILNNIVFILRRTDRVDARAEAFALAVRDELGAIKFADATDLFHLLDTRMHARNSYLWKKTRWQELGLPNIG